MERRVHAGTTLDGSSRGLMLGFTSQQPRRGDDERGQG